MECKKCGVELMIMDRGPLLFENDDRADMPTRAYYNYKFGCRNPECEEFEGFSTRNRFILTIDENQPTQTGGFYIAPCAA